MSDRQALHVLLSEQAHRGLREFAERHGISLSAMLESIGMIMAAELVEDGTGLEELGQIVVMGARGIDASRRVRAR